MKENRQELSLNSFPAAKSYLEKFEVIYVPDASVVPDNASAEAKLLKSINVKAFISVPMVLENKLIGFLGFESFKKIRWGNDVISLLKMTAGTLVNAIARKRIRHDLIEVVLNRLSSREREFFQYLIDGYQWPSDKRLIGKKMDVLPGTLDRFMSRVKQKIRNEEIEHFVNSLSSNSFIETEKDNEE